MPILGQKVAWMSSALTSTTASSRDYTLLAFQDGESASLTWVRHTPGDHDYSAYFNIVSGQLESEAALPSGGTRHKCSLSIDA